MNGDPTAHGSQVVDTLASRTRGRLIVAPVGNQPAAILAPLLTPPLRPTSEDRLILVASQESAPYAQRIAEELNRTGTSCETTATAVIPPDDAFATIERAAGDREAWLLANGGPVQWTLRLVDGLRRAARDLAIVVSRDQRVFVLDAVGRVREELTACDLGLERLLDLLGLALRGEEEARALFDGPREVLSDIVHIEERSGLLFVAIDASKWADLDGRYRPALLAWRELQKKGLDHRRILLLKPPSEDLRERARSDRFVLDAEDFGLDEWRAAIRERHAADLPEAMDAATPRGISGEELVQITGAGSWSGDPLVVVMGPQPGTTLRAVWCHEPSAVLVLFDETQPESCRLTRLLADALRGRAGEIVCRSYRGSDPFASWSQRDLDVHLTPGDKLTKLQLQLWAAQDPARRSPWTLEDNRSCRQGASPGRPKDGSPVPLEVWVKFHSPTDVAIGLASLPAEVTPLAAELLHWLDRLPTPPSGLSMLWHRASSGPPFLDGDVLHWPDRRVGERSIPLADLPRDFADACRPKEGGSNGQWFEWLVAAALKAAGVEEVALNAIYRNPDLEASRHRDELDVVTRHERVYGLWSCKSNAKQLNRHWLAARAQSDRLLGRQSLAVLVVPRLAGGPPPGGFSEIVPGHWYRKECGHIIDALFLVAGNGGIAKLACHSDYHPHAAAAQ